MKIFLQKVTLQIGLKNVICDHNGEEIARTIYEKELQKKYQKVFEIRKVISKKGNKLYVKWKGYNSSFNSWIDMKDIV